MADKNQLTEIQVESKGPIALIRVSGELDALAGPQLEEAAVRALDGGARRCIVDLAAATFIDSIGVGALIRSHRTAAEHDSAVFIAGAHGMIAQLIKVTQLNRIFRVFPTLDEALATANAEVQQ